MTPKALLSAAIADRDAFDSIAASEEPGSFPDELKPIWEGVKKYYELSPEAESADIDTVVAYSVDGMANPKHRKATEALVRETGPSASHGKNPKELVRLAGLSRVRNELAVALGSRQKYEDVEPLLLQFQSLSIPESDDPELGWNGIVRKRTDRKGRMRVSPKGLNEALGGGLLPGHNLTIFGLTECIAADQKVRVSRLKNCKGSKTYTLEALWRRWAFNKRGKGKAIYIQSARDNGKVYYNKILDVIASGKKEVFEIKTANGFSVKATATHRIAIGGGLYANVRDLRVGDGVLTDRRTATARKHRQELTTKLPKTPYKTRVVAGQEYQRVKVSRLVYDAHLNGLTFNGFLEAIRQGRGEMLVYSDPFLDIHHIDGDHCNDVPENLRLISRAEHTRLHARQKDIGHSRHSEISRIVSIEPKGMSQCFDIEVQGPDHNFRAGGIYVHNCGKSALALSMAVGFARRGHKVLYVINEDAVQDLMLRAISCMTGRTYDIMEQAPDEAEAEAIRLGIGNLVMRELAPGTLGELEKLVRQHKPAVLVVDQLRNIDGKKSSNNTERLDKVAQGVRAIGKRYKLATISVTQGADSGRDKAYLDTGDIDSSNVGIPGAADVLVGVGMNDALYRAGQRVLSLCKNKLTGKHAHITVNIRPEISRFTTGD